MNGAAGMGPEPDARPEDGRIEPDVGNLRDYAKMKHSLAQAVRSIRGIASETKNERIVGEGQDLMSKLAEDRFTLAVVGQFKRGKSSLMNAIIGREILPTGVLPLTSAITILKYGPVEKLTIQRDKDIFPEQPPVAMLAAYVTEEGNPGNSRKVKAAVLEEPLAFLRRGLEFVDTPGIGSAIQANTETTYAFLPQCDAVVFVTGLDSPLTEAEMDFLRCTRQFAQKMFFVVNKIDLLDGVEREKALRFISERLQGETRNDSGKVFPLSSRLAMAAKAASDPAGYAASGLKGLEEALGEFLSRERTDTFLASVLARAVRIAEDLRSSLPTGSSAAQCDKVTNTLESVRVSLSPGTAPARPSTVQVVATPLADERTSTEPAIDWPKALHTRGCPICARMAGTAFDFYAHWQHALVVDEAKQDQFAAEMGFCPLHTWQSMALSSPQGASAGYARLAERCARQLSQLAATPETAAAGLAALTSHGERCAACREIRAAEENAVRGLAAFLATPAGLRAYRDSQGVCMRHLALVSKLLGRAELVRQVLQHAAKRFEETAEDMQNYAMKHDGIRRWLQNQDEKDACLRAVMHIVGEKAACGLWQEDIEI